MLTEAEIESICRIDIVERVEETEGRLVLYTKEFKCQNTGWRPRHFHIPEGRIIMRTKAGKGPYAKFYYRDSNTPLRLDYTRYGALGHPHVMNTGCPCYGNIARQFYQVMRDQEFVLAANLICIFLKTCHV